MVPFHTIPTTKFIHCFRLAFFPFKLGMLIIHYAETNVYQDGINIEEQLLTIFFIGKVNWHSDNLPFPVRYFIFFLKLIYSESVDLKKSVQAQSLFQGSLLSLRSWVNSRNWVVPAWYRKSLGSPSPTKSQVKHCITHKRHETKDGGNVSHILYVKRYKHMSFFGHPPLIFNESCELYVL